MLKKNILIVSHRRSGTHLTIDLIRNNFKEYHMPYISLLKEYKIDVKNSNRLNNFENKTNIPRIFKSHSRVDYLSFYSNSKKIQKIMFALLNNSKVIYIHREGKDVLTSLFYHTKDSTSEERNLSEFIREKNYYHQDKECIELNMIQYWHKHVNEWLNWIKLNGQLSIRYEDLINNYNKLLEEISNFIGFKSTEPLVDVRLSKESKNQLIPKWANDVVTKRPTYSHVNFRKGNIGDYKTHFEKSDIKFYNNCINHSIY